MNKDEEIQLPVVHSYNNQITMNFSADKQETKFFWT